MAEIETPTQDVVAQKNKQVGDEEVAEVSVPKPEINSDKVKAQVSPPREKEVGTVPVHETSVQTDTVVTDPSSPEAVQVPDAGRGDASLPIHRLAEGTPEDYFAEHASEQDESDESPADENQS